MSLPGTPDGFHTVTPSLTIQGAAAAIDFYKTVFNAQESMRLAAPNGTVMHAEITVGNSKILLSDEFPDWNMRGPHSIGGCPSALMIYVADADATVAKAVEAGAKLLRPVQNQFWGDRTGQVEDPFGYRWSIATRVEEVTPAEIERRASAWMSQSS